MHSRRIEGEFYEVYELTSVEMPELLDRACGTIHVRVALEAGRILIQEQADEVVIEQRDGREVLRIEKKDL